MTEYAMTEATFCAGSQNCPAPQPPGLTRQHDNVYAGNWRVIGFALANVGKSTNDHMCIAYWSWAREVGR